VRKYSLEEVLAVINEAVGDRYSPRILDNGTIYYPTSRSAQKKLDQPTDRQNAFNRIMKKIHLEDGNEFNPLYSDRGEGTEINEIIDYAVSNGLLASDTIRNLAPRQYNKFYNSPEGEIISKAELARKAGQTLKERFWKTDSNTGANFDGVITNIGHTQSQKNYPELARVAINNRTEHGPDNSNYKNFTGQQLVDRNNELLDQSRGKLGDEVVDEMEMDIKLQMIADSIEDPQQRVQFMIDTGMATPDQLGIDKIKTRDVDATNMKRFAASPAVQELMQEIEAGRDAQAAGAVVGEKPLVVNAGEGSKVYLHTNGNGKRNGHAEVQKAFDQYIA
tara:strand:+ start:2213 stop:3214 length:1002 start_codon:yes stop_codon:yes gene_type:complete